MILVKGGQYYFLTPTEFDTIFDADSSAFSDWEYSKKFNAYAVEVNWDSDYWIPDPETGEDHFDDLHLAEYVWSGRRTLNWLS